MSEIKNCYCGGRATYGDNSHAVYDDDGYFVDYIVADEEWVMCNKCGREVRVPDNEVNDDADVIEMWNKSCNGSSLKKKQKGLCVSIMAQFHEITAYQCIKCGAILLTQNGMERHGEHCKYIEEQIEGQIDIFDKEEAE